jgi:hypothetical protein
MMMMMVMMMLMMMMIWILGYSISRWKDVKGDGQGLHVLGVDQSLGHSQTHRMPMDKRCTACVIHGLIYPFIHPLSISHSRPFQRSQRPSDQSCRQVYSDIAAAVISVWGVLASASPSRAWPTKKVKRVGPWLWHSGHSKCRAPPVISWFTPPSICRYLHHKSTCRYIHYMTLHVDMFIYPR